MTIKKKTATIVLSSIIAFCVAVCVVTGFIVKAVCSPKPLEVECIDGCDVPRYDENGNEVFAVVSPVGYCDVDMIEQAPRLDTLDDKTIALVGGSFMASTTHFELKRCIEEEYENVTIYMFNQVGTAGNFAVPSKGDSGNDGNTNTQVKRFQNKLKELSIDAVIGGNGGCGICTMKETGSAIAAEYIGIPAVMVASPTFVEEVHSIGVSRGVPVLRTAEYPGAFASHTEKQLKENARHVVWPQIKEALTKQIKQAEINLYKNNGERPYDEIIYYGNNDEVQDYFKYNEWTDGLPVGLPTPAKVQEYLKFTPYKADDILGGADGKILMANRKNYAYTVAVNAVMSGVPAEFMPLCIAFVECMDYGDWYRTLISSHGWSPYAWINGPVARQLGIDFGQGAISEETNKALAINLTQSAASGSVTRGGTTVIISSTVEETYFDLGGTVIVDSENTENFVTFADGKLTINPDAAVGSVCTFKADNGNGTYRTVKFTMKLYKQISIEYENGETK